MWQSELCHVGVMAEDSGMTYEQMLEPGTEGLGQVMAKEELRVPWGGSGLAGLAAILLLWGLGGTESNRILREGTPIWAP